MDEVVFKWVIEDVRWLHPEFTPEQCRETLARFDRHNEGSMEQMWRDLRLHADEVAAEENESHDVA
jgi:hypothetical protein